MNRPGYHWQLNEIALAEAVALGGRHAPGGIERRPAVVVLPVQDVARTSPATSLASMKRAMSSPVPVVVVSKAPTGTPDQRRVSHAPRPLPRRHAASGRGCSGAAPGIDGHGTDRVMPTLGWLGRTGGVHKGRRGTSRLGNGPLCQHSRELGLAHIGNKGRVIDLRAARGWIAPRIPYARRPAPVQVQCELQRHLRGHLLA